MGESGDKKASHPAKRRGGVISIPSLVEEGCRGIPRRGGGV